ncbi:MAG: hypothetical protein DHS20C16_21880 [Phycisphaerae bacterium]|nr:MAG: hypothetical protein DHS20C16_21880 [Phycisphaerae bacterium]
MELFKDCWLTVVRTQKENKLRAVAKIIANSLLRPGDAEELEFTELDFFSRCVDSLPIGAIDVVGQVARIAQSREAKNFRKSNVQLDFGELHQRVKEKPDFLMVLCEELNSFHLIHLTSAPTVRTPNYGNYSLEIPPIGVRFVTHILESGYSLPKRKKLSARSP